MQELIRGILLKIILLSDFWYVFWLRREKKIIIIRKEIEKM